MQNNDNLYGTRSASPAFAGADPEEALRLGEKRSLRRTCTAIGIFVLIYYLTLQQTAGSLADLVSSMRIATEENQTALLFLIQTAACVFAPLLAAFFYKLIFRRKLSEGLTESFVKPGVLAPLVLLGMGAAMIANNMAALFDSNISIFMLKNYAQQSTDTRGVPEMVLYVISTAVVPALAEEFAFRGVVMGALRKYGDAFAIFASALLFGAMHGNTTQIVFAFVLGLIFAFTDCKANSIIPSVTIHFINNFYAVVEDILISNSAFDEGTIQLIRMGLILFFCTAGFVSYVFFAKTDSHFFRTANGDKNSFSSTDILSFREKLRLFFTSAGVIISLCLFFAETVYYLLPSEIRKTMTSAFSSVLPF